MSCLGAMWLALFPFWQDGSFSRITHSKWVGMLVLTAVTVIACGHMILRLCRQREQHVLRVGPVQCIAMVYFGLVALSATFGSWHTSLNDNSALTVLWGARRYEGLLTQLCYGAIFLCLSLTPLRLRPVMDAAADALLLFCAVVALQYAEINVLELFPEGRSIRTNYEFQGTIGNIDMVVGYVSLVMPLLLCGFVLEKRGGWLWLTAGLAGLLLTLCMEVQCGLIMAAAMLFALVLLGLMRPRIRGRVLIVLGGAMAMAALRLTLRLPRLDAADEVMLRFSLPALVLALAGVGLIAASPLAARSPGKPLSGRTVLLIALAALVLALAVVYLAPMPQGSGLWELREILHGRPQDAFGSERLGIWRLTLELSGKNLLFGTGPDTFLYAMEDYQAQTGQTLNQVFDNPHNIFLSILSNCGLPALLAFVALCIAAVLPALRRIRRDRTLLPLALAAACFLLQGMFTFSLCLVSPMFWACLGMLTALAHPVPAAYADADPA